MSGESQTRCVDRRGSSQMFDRAHLLKPLDDPDEFDTCCYMISKRVVTASNAIPLCQAGFLRIERCFFHRLVSFFVASTTVFDPSKMAILRVWAAVRGTSRVTSPTAASTAEQVIIPDLRRLRSQGKRDTPRWQF